MLIVVCRWLLICCLHYVGHYNQAGSAFLVKVTGKSGHGFHTWEQVRRGPLKEKDSMFFKDFVVCLFSDRSWVNGLKGEDYYEDESFKLHF